MLRAEAVIALMFFVLVLGAFALISIPSASRLLRVGVEVRRLWNIDAMKNVRPVLKAFFWMIVAATFILTFYNWFANWLRMP